MEPTLSLAERIGLIEDERAVIRLQTAYGYYVDKAQWDEAADLFAADATLEIAGRGLYRGQDRIRSYLKCLPSLLEGTVFNHMQLQPLITLEGDHAWGRWRAIMEVAIRGKVDLVGEATYENRYVRDGGVWKIARLHCFVTYYADWQAGLSGGGVPMGTELPEFPPDAPQTVAYGSFPSVFVPPYHYANPVTGQTWVP
ncbi:nuclear transport factor 2 family protein [Novosphingobium flavum]|uniref:Nuclear transport factor 2 family protein n=1 Tax=Novosphingobium aerophilum TaxID=2839843 RepID=A0A7X1F6B2_9SPHN|nr:nuclear transport factor 2 family protein [Novosphingobium aerophilum]MBC2651205.1 nuclear transport factor 2 family protein [Novosphingobium aerophilum]MBC2660762.1 nuclear transport factor 2 family protein [Novosphingobium aerophilum]